MLSKQVKQRIAFNREKRKHAAWKWRRHKWMNQLMLQASAGFDFVTGAPLKDEGVIKKLQTISTMNRQEFLTFMKTGVLPAENQYQTRMKWIFKNALKRVKDTTPVLVVDSLGQL